MIFRFFKFRRRLKKSGVLGNNSRLIDYILPHNNRAAFPYVDDKIRTIALLDKKNIPYPKTIKVINSISDTRGLHKSLQDIGPFVVKPSNGAAGNGILLVNEVQWAESRSDTYLVTNRKEKMSFSEFEYYLSMILSGVFSLSGHQDRALVQEKLNVHPFFESISYKGIPDIRVIVFKNFPVMAMVRLPTKASGGRGNLHQGALGCGVDLKTGCITGAVMNNKFVSSHPDFSDEKLIGRIIPKWEEILEVACRCSENIEIQYLGVDIVLDPVQGPLVLEMNARPGLSIQLANQKGLEAPLERIVKASSDEMTMGQKIQFAQNI